MKNIVFDKFECSRILYRELHSASQTFGKHSRTSAWREIAARTGLSPATIAKMASRETHYPRFSTIATLFKYFGYRLIAQRS